MLRVRPLCDVFEFWQITHNLLEKSSAVAEMGDRLATIDMGRKLGRLSPFYLGELGPHLTQCRLSRAYFPTNWHLDPSSHLATIDMGRKLEAVSPF